MVDIEKVGKGLKTSLSKLFERVRSLLCTENQEIIHSVFDEVILFQ
jgi:hypothetical protein